MSDLELWRNEIIKTTGAVTGRRTSNKAQVRRCRKCGAVILAGLDAPMCAVDVDLDPTPLKRDQQKAAALIGRRVYDIDMGGAISYRESDHIQKYWPAGGTSRFVQHLCGAAVPVDNSKVKPPKTVTDQIGF